MIYRGIFTSVLLVIVVINSAPTFALSDEGASNVMRYMMGLSKECFKSGLTQEGGLGNMRNRNRGRDPKCFVTCVMKKTGMLNDDASFNRDATTEFIKRMPTIPVERREEFTNNVIEKCGNFQSDDECETGFMYHMCGWGEYKLVREVNTEKGPTKN